MCNWKKGRSWIEMDQSKACWNKRELGEKNTRKMDGKVKKEEKRREREQKRTKKEENQLYLYWRLAHSSSSAQVQKSSENPHWVGGRIIIESHRASCQRFIHVVCRPCPTRWLALLARNSLLLGCVARYWLSSFGGATNDPPQTAAWGPLRVQSYAGRVRSLMHKSLSCFHFSIFSLRYPCCFGFKFSMRVFLNWVSFAIIFLLNTVILSIFYHLF